MKTSVENGEEHGSIIIMLFIKVVDPQGCLSGVEEACEADQNVKNDVLSLKLLLQKGKKSDSDRNCLQHLWFHRFPLRGAGLDLMKYKSQHATPSPQSKECEGDTYLSPEGHAAFCGSCLYGGQYRFASHLRIWCGVTFGGEIEGDRDVMHAF